MLSDRWGVLILAGWPGLVLSATLVLAACAGPARVEFPGGTPQAPLTITGDLTRPEGAGPFPTVVLLHGCGGIRPHVRYWADWLRGEGYVALAIDTFGPRGYPNLCGLRSHVTESMSDALNALAYLRRQPFIDGRRVALMGWSSGGIATLRLASVRTQRWQVPEGGFRAAVAFYPGSPHCEMDPNRIPTLLLLAGADNWSPPGSCVQQATAYQRAGRTIEWVVFTGGHHGFDEGAYGSQPRRVLGRYTLQYDPGSTSDAERRIRAFLQAHLGR